MPLLVESKIPVPWLTRNKDRFQPKIDRKNVNASVRSDALPEEVVRLSPSICLF